MTRRDEVEAHALACRGALARGDARPAWAGADLTGADLAKANLCGADLRGAYLTEANLSEANLSGADLIRADLAKANLCGADLSEADLRGADLAKADLTRADLRGTCLDPAAPIPPMTDEQILAAGLCEEVAADGVAWLVGRRSRRSLHVGSQDYSEPGEYVAPWLSVDVASECHPGIYLGGAPEEHGADRVRARCRRDEAVYVSPEKGVRTRTLVRTAADVAAGGDR